MAGVEVPSPQQKWGWHEILRSPRALYIDVPMMQHGRSIQERAKEMWRPMSPIREASTTHVSRFDLTFALSRAIRSICSPCSCSCCSVLEPTSLV